MRLKKLYHKFGLILILLRTVLKRKVLIFDIDETVCFTNYKHYCLEAAAIDRNINLIQNIGSGYIKVFLTARPVKYSLMTYKWLRLNNVDFSLGFAGFEPKNKLWIIRILEGLNYDIIYMDDLSFREVNGDVKSYISVIDEVKKLNIRYIGLEEL